MRTKVIYEDKDIMVIHKPAGLATQTGQIGSMDVVSELKNYLAAKGEDSYVGVIHRLDQPVEGLLVFAKNKRAAAHMSGQLAKDNLNKEYDAVVCGVTECREETLTDYLRKGNDSRAQVVTGEEARFPDARRAVLHYCVKEEAPPFPGTTLIHVTLQTGRFHQIRAQMAHAGYPLLGDVKYGNEMSAELSRQYGIRQVALCASAMSLQHPVTGKKLHFEIKPVGGGFGNIF
ncbi:MAG: RluA family pseudouridine synthase [Acetatifactor sp.]|nr:RluA family pseudouridine synthase [Acetatifactor sp.]